MPATHTYKIDYHNEEQAIHIEKDGTAEDVHFGDIVNIGNSRRIVYIGNGEWRENDSPANKTYPFKIPDFEGDARLFIEEQVFFNSKDVNDDPLFNTVEEFDVFIPGTRKSKNIIADQDIIAGQGIITDVETEMDKIHIDGSVVGISSGTRISTLVDGFTQQLEIGRKLISQLGNFNQATSIDVSNDAGII